MKKQKIYPRYTDNFLYEEGDIVILIKRMSGDKLICENRLRFDTSEEAKSHFEEHCGV